MFPHYITGPTQREEILREIKIFLIKFLNIIEVLGDYIRVIDLSSPTPSNPLGTRSNPLGPVLTRWDPL